MSEETENRYAIVGMGGLFPDAPDLSAFWRNILDKRVSITRLPDDSVERQVYFRPEVLRKQNKGDRSYTDLYAAINAVDFDPERFRIPPSVAKHMDENQKVALLATEQAMAGHGLDAVSKERVGVVIGNSGYGSLHHKFYRRFAFDRFAHTLEHDPFVDQFIPVEQRKAFLEQLREKVLVGTFGLSEDSAPGILPSIVASRISSVFDFHGQTMVLDTACASGLAAVSCALQQLQLRQSDAVICGAVDMPVHEVGRLYFSAIGALSPDGSFPFDARANGFVIGQGGGVIILKRLDDAIAAGDSIQGVITGVGLSTDGKGKAIAAPNEVWQATAIRAAYQDVGYPVDTVELIEAHGTSTQVGDKSEVNALKRAFSALGSSRKDFCGISSVKSNIGHLKSAAGIAGLLKASLALQHKWLPPTANFERQSPAINLVDSPFYVLAEGKPWAESSTPRRAGVSSFGFGGVNYHVALQEYRPGEYSSRPSVARKPNPSPSVRGSSLSTVALFAGATLEDLLQQVAEVRQSLERAEADVGEILATLNGRTHRSRALRLAFAVSSREDLIAKLDLLRDCAPAAEALAQLQPRGIQWSAQEPVNAAQVAVLFPGQGSQFPGMLGFVRRQFQAAHTLEARANRLWQELAGTTVSALVEPGADDAEAAEARLRDTVNTHPTVLTVSLAAHAVLEQMGLRPAVMMGHSLGEYAALVAAGRLSLGEGLKLMRARGAALGQACEGDGGTMLALPLDAEASAALIAESKLPVSVANRNSPRQTIVAGSREAIDSFRGFATDKGHRAVILNVSRAFHSPLMQEAERVFEAELRQTDFRPSRTPVLSAVDAQILGDSRDAVCATLSKQITSSVDFIAGIERLYADGIRVFVEVGPSSVLSGLTKDILGKRPGLVLSCDGRKPDSDEAFLRLLCALHVAGLPIDPSAAATTESAERPVAPVVSASPAVPAASSGAQRIVYSGVSVGLPGSYKDAFRDDNFQQLFEGRNFIERLTDGERQALLDLHISKVVKSEQGASIVELQTLNEVIQLAGKLGRLDLAANYQIDDKELQTMSTCVAHAVAAGYEALRDAQIPLVLEYTRTSSGRFLPDRWALPREMQASTGIIFANGFPLIDPVIAEVSRHLSLTLGRRTREALYEFYDGLIAKVTHPESRKLLADWFALHYGRLSASPSQDQVYRFNHQLMTQISLQANNRLAKRLNARGPNFQLNAACSSAATAIMLAEEMIRAGRIERMIVIGADDPTSTNALPYLGAGFLATGACSNRADLYEAALPFDKRRDGMIMGSGAMAIVIEPEALCARRGLTPVCELLGTHVFNAASHGSQLDVARYAEELEIFIARMERRYGLSRKSLAPELVYFSHEPYTPARGGCSESEATALRHVFGDQVGQVEVSNTKGMTGHTMGASIEDVAAAKSLQFGRVPPVVNHKVPDPTLAGLTLSKGSARSFQYALRMAAGFGSQGNYVLLKRVAVGDKRISNPATYQSWLRTISAQDKPELVDLGRLLVVKDGTPGAVVSERPRIDCAPRQSSAAAESKAAAPKPVATAPAPAPAAQDSPELEHIRERVLDIVSNITGYKRSLLDMDMELEADLGVDTVKQATILATLAESFGMTDMENIHLSDYPTLRRLVGLLSGKFGAGATAAGGTTDATTASPTDASAASAPASTADLDAVTVTVREIVADITGYRLALVEPSMELEADLGVDTVKQATILARLAKRFGISDEPNSFRISEFPTVGHLAAFFAKAAGQGLPALAPAPTPALAPVISKPSAAPAAPKQPVEAVKKPAARTESDTQSRIINLLAECTPYPVEMLEPDLTLDSDLGLDAGVRERLRKACIDAFHLDDDWQLPINARIADLPALLNASPRPASPPVERADRMGMARQILALRPAPLTGQPESLAEKRVWIWGDDPACVQGLRTALQAQVRELRTMIIPADPEEAVQLAQRELGQAAPDILIDTTACGVGLDFASAEPETFSPALARAADCRFALWKHLLGKKLMPGRTFALTMVDGAHGLAGSGSAINPLFGLHVGFYKSVRKLAARDVRILDLAPTSVAEIAWAPLLAELSAQGPGVEICYREGARHRVVLVDSVRPNLDSAGTLAQDEVMVVTGGGAGITAAIVKHLAVRAPRHLAIIGRTSLGPETRRFHALAPADRENEKDAIRERLVRGGQKATPVLVDKAYAALERAAEIHDTLAALEAAGAHVTYHEADVCDGARMASVLAEIRRVHGPITSLIHGAGIEISRTIDKKSLEEFQSVLRTKVLGAFHLGWLCRQDPLRRVVAISSIAGRMGSPAQIDYAAANGFLDLWARQAQQRPGTRGLSLIWSAWAEQGMAWRNTFVRENAERTGLGFIDPVTGARAAVDEMMADSTDVEVVLHRGLGDVLDPELADVDPRPFPFVDWCERAHEGVAYWRHFSPQRDGMLDHHRLGKTSLMPGVGLMEMMAEAHLLLTGMREGALVYRQLAFADALKFYHDAGRDVQLRVDGPRMEAWSTFRSLQGDIVQDRLYARAQVTREPAQPPVESPALWDLGRTIDRMSFASTLEKAHTLQHGMNLGPLLTESSRPGHDPATNQVVVCENGILTRIDLPKAQLSDPRYPLARLQVNPAFLDSMHQAAAIFSVLKTGSIHLPVGADEFTIFEAPDREAHYDVIAVVRERSSDRLWFDVALLHEGRQLFCLARRVELRRTGQ